MDENAKFWRGVTITEDNAGRRVEIVTPVTVMADDEADVREASILEVLSGDYIRVERTYLDGAISTLYERAFISPEAKADATVETAMPTCHKCGTFGQKVRILNGIYTCDSCYDAGHGHAIPCIKPGCGCHEYDEKGRPKAVHIQCPVEREIRVDYSDLSAMQPVAAVDFADVVRFAKERWPVNAPYPHEADRRTSWSSYSDAAWASLFADNWECNHVMIHAIIRPAYEAALLSHTNGDPKCRCVACRRNASPIPQTVNVTTGNAARKGAVHAIESEFSCGCRARGDEWYYACPTHMRQINDAKAESKVEETKVCHACRAPFSLASKDWCLLDSNLYFCAEDSKAAIEMWDKLRDYFREGSTRLSPEKRAVFTEAEKMPPRDEEAKRRRENLDAAIIRECRAAIMRSGQYPEWPRCKDHDAPMAVKCCLPYSGNGKRYVFAGCLHEGCGRTSSPVEIELSGPTARALDGESWTAQEFRT